MTWPSLFSLALCMLVASNSESFASQELISSRTDRPILVDGLDNDAAWQHTPAIISHDRVGDIPITLKAVHTADTVYLLVSFPDQDESRTHKSWEWNKKLEMYDVGPDREDIFIIKWNMEKRPTDLSLSAGNKGNADIWYWKACRTDPVGYADDKMHIINSTTSINATQITTISGEKHYLYRQEDAGMSAYRIDLPTGYGGETLPRFKHQSPTDSRADVRAKGHWQDNRWVIEFSRKLQTGHNDDLQMQSGKAYQFGVSRYEIAGRPPNPKLTQPLYGSGDINEMLTLTLAP